MSLQVYLFTCLQVYKLEVERVELLSRASGGVPADGYRTNHLPEEILQGKARYLGRGGGDAALSPTTRSPPPNLGDRPSRSRTRGRSKPASKAVFFPLFIYVMGEIRHDR